MTRELLNSRAEQLKEVVRRREEATSAAREARSAREEVLSDTRGAAVESLLTSDQVRTCVEFLRIMRASSFPGISQLRNDGMSPHQGVKINVSSGGLGRLLGLRAVKSDPRKEILAEGYPIGMASIYSNDELVRFLETAKNLKNRFVVRGNEIRALALEKNVTIVSLHHGYGVYLCDDGRLRNEHGGSVPSKDSLIIGGLITVERGDYFNQMNRYVAKLPLEDVLAVHAIETGVV